MLKPITQLMKCQQRIKCYQFISRRYLASNKKFNKLATGSKNDNQQNEIKHDDQIFDKLDDQLGSDDLNSNEEFGLTDNDVKNLTKKGSELAQFREDINKLTLAESLSKYECSIKDALHLDTELQKRIMIKGLVVDRIFRTNKLKLRVLDTNTFDMIRVYIPYHVYENRLDDINKGSSVVVTGLVFNSLGLDENSFYCDKLIYVNHSTFYAGKALFERERTIRSYFKLRDYPTFKFRTTITAALIKLRSEFINHLHRLMNEEQFIHVNAPILTSFPIQEHNAFEVRNLNRDNYFSSPVYLVKDSDKHLESITCAIPQIYTITHTFTSNDVRSKQVSNESLCLEVAQATDDKLDDLMDQVEYFVKKLSSTFAQISKGKNQLTNEKHKVEYKLDSDAKFIRMTYDEAKELLSQKEITLEPNESLTFYHKQIISEYFENAPVFLYGFAYDLRTDYDTLNVDGNGQKFELLINKGLTGCRGKIKANQTREELGNKLKELGYDLDQENIEWYLDLKQKGSVPSSWFSLSIDQFLMTFVDLPSLRDTILFPRVPNHCEL